MLTEPLEEVLRTRTTAALDDTARRWEFEAALEGDAWEFLQRCTLRRQAMLRDGVTPLILLMKRAADVPLHR
jgi:hypothetical protein